jgi:site-specific recombinase XerD
MFKSIPFLYDNELKREIDIRGLSYGTFKNYRSHLRRISKYVEKDIKEISIVEAKDYLYYLKNTLNQNPQTINLVRAAFIFFKQGVLGEYIQPYTLPRHKVVHKLPDILASKDILTTFDCLSLKYRAVLSLCYGSGLRISEALALEIGDIDSDSMRVFVRCGKGGKSRFSILSAYSLKCLRLYWKSYRPPGPMLFPKRDAPEDAKPPQHIQKSFTDAYDKRFPYSNKKITTRTLRHCFATHLLDNGTDLRTIQILLGHKSIQSTAIYTQLTDIHFSKLVSPIDRERV